MDWEGIKTAYLDRQRARLGLPTREALATKRAEEARQAAESASQLESAGVARDYSRARMEALPAEEEQKRRLIEAQISNYGETAQPRAESSTLEERLMALPPAQREAAVAFYQRLHPKPAAAGGVGAANLPKNGWSAQYGPDGKLIGYTHPAVGFKSTADLGIPADSRPTALSSGERDALALGNVPIRAGETMGKALEATQTAEQASPFDPATWTGPIAGRLGGAYRGAIDSSGPAGDFDQAAREARSLVYALSGKQINETEQAWLDRIVPRLSDRGAPQQLVRFNRFVGYLRAAKQKGYADPFAVAQAQADQELPSAGGAEPPPAAGATTTVRSQSDYDALPSGTVFFTPEGKRKRKP